ncbi:hypothetical protein GC102_07310 [Paenibacillus sp. LMG 31460]|uniref:Uncharacterized protein n=1 Tax=Paenibacillus germinis TaxID=2654979 RepID=A0ABX1YXA6_9BACL|nr:hypothetical protein [Paenibacillus germinis]NOU85586.1 hypothetical protein [Paenibacillus germinis]
MKFMCECGHPIYDTTDYLSYKAHLISDQDWFDFLEEIDSAIEKSGPSEIDKEKALMKIRSLSSNLTKKVYQCNKCRNMFFYNNPPRLEVFRPSSDSVNKKLLRSAHGDKWKGFLNGDWMDNNLAWRVKGFITASCLDEGKQYDDWEILEKEYYLVFNELSANNLLRSSSLKKNGNVFHTWNLTALWRSFN